MMRTRDEQFLALYQQRRFKDQQVFYHNRRTEFETAYRQAIKLSGWLMFLASASAALATAAVGGWTREWALLAVIFPALSTAISAYNELYAFEQQTKLYQDAATALLRARADAPDLKRGINDNDYRQALSGYVNEVENVFRKEQGQWGQLISEIKPVEPPPDSQNRTADKDRQKGSPAGAEKAEGA